MANSERFAPGQSSTVSPVHRLPRIGQWSSAPTKLISVGTSRAEDVRVGTNGTSKIERPQHACAACPRMVPSPHPHSEGALAVKGAVVLR